MKYSEKIEIINAIGVTAELFKRVWLNPRFQRLQPLFVTLLEFANGSSEPFECSRFQIARRLSDLGQMDMVAQKRTINRVGSWVNTLVESQSACLIQYEPGGKPKGKTTLSRYTVYAWIVIDDAMSLLPSGYGSLNVRIKIISQAVDAALSQFQSGGGDVLQAKIERFRRSEHTRATRMKTLLTQCEKLVRDGRISGESPSLIVMMSEKLDSMVMEDRVWRGKPDYIRRVK